MQWTRLELRVESRGAMDKQRPSRARKAKRFCKAGMILLRLIEQETLLDSAWPSERDFYLDALVRRP